MLEQYRIGRLKGGLPAKAMADPYANEPQRLPALIVRTQKPMNAGGCTAGRALCCAASAAAAHAGGASPAPALGSRSGLFLRRLPPLWQQRFCSTFQLLLVVANPSSAAVTALVQCSLAAGPAAFLPSIPACLPFRAAKGAAGGSPADAQRAVLHQEPPARTADRPRNVPPESRGRGTAHGEALGGCSTVQHVPCLCRIDGCDAALLLWTAFWLCCSSACSNCYWQVPLASSVFHSQPITSGASPAHSWSCC
jgi:hypothetical protein